MTIQHTLVNIESMRRSIQSRQDIIVAEVWPKLHEIPGSKVFTATADLMTIKDATT